MVDLTDIELHDGLAEACRVAAVPSVGARMLHHYSNVVFVLPSANAVARMTPGTKSTNQIEISQTVVAWLVAEHGFGATEPLPGTTPVVVDAGQSHPRELTVSFWRYYPQPAVSEARAFDATDLAVLLKQLHSISIPKQVTGPGATAQMRCDLSQWRPLTTLRSVLNAEPTHAGLSEKDAAWLLDQVNVVTDEVEAFDWPLEPGLIHGDAWAGNLLWDTSMRPILGDWDGVSFGPREIDLIPTWHAAVRYGRDRSWVERFVASYGYDLAASPGFDLLMRMRDLVQLSGPMRRAKQSAAHHAALRQRFEAIRDGDRATTWTGL